MIEVKDVMRMGSPYYKNRDVCIWIELPFGCRALVPVNAVDERSWLIPDCLDWLEDHVGRQSVAWAFYNMHNKHHELSGFRILFPDKSVQRDVALLFKLTWGGS